MYPKDGGGVLEAFMAQHGDYNMLPDMEKMYIVPRTEALSVKLYYRYYQHVYMEEPCDDVHMTYQQLMKLQKSRVLITGRNV